MTSSLLLLAGGAAAGLFGSLLGLGGGILIVPMLTLGLGVPLREAVAVSLVSVIVTSSASAGVYLQRHVANLRLGMALEVFTAAGALVGGMIAFLIEERVLAGLFALLMVWVLVSMLRRRDPAPASSPVSVSSPAPTAAAPAPSAHDDTDAAPSVPPVERSFTASLSGAGYHVRRYPMGIAGSLFAGLVSALLGVGGGIVKVPVMHLVMGVPLKVATATSNMMIGITATSSAVIYLLRGEIDPYIAGPTALGVFVGASIGSRIVGRIHVTFLRWLFVAVLAYTAVEMALKALGR